MIVKLFIPKANEYLCYAVKALPVRVGLLSFSSGNIWKFQGKSLSL